RNLRKKQNLRYLQRIHEKSFGRATQSFFSNSSYENEIDYVVAGPNRYDEKSIDIDFLENHTYQEHDSCNNEDQIILENEMLQILYEEDSVDDDSYESEQDEHETLIDSENKKNKSFFIEIVKFIRQSNLNKTTTISLLSLLRSVHKLNIHDIPTATDALWKKLDISFNYESFFFCTNCFQQLTKFTDICFMCNNKRNVNSELCIFSLVNEIERVVAANIKLMEWYELPENQTGADIINSPIYKQQRSFGTSQITLMLSTDGKNIIKSRQTQSSVWPIMSFIAEIPYPIREYYNNIILLGLWHSRVTPPASILLDKIVKNLKLLKATGVNLQINNTIRHFSVKVQLISGDLPARSKCNQLVNHNGFYCCSRCLMEGWRCAKPCGHHTLYRWIDFIQSPPPPRTQEHINECAKRIGASSENSFGVVGVSPLFSLLSVPKQSTFDYFHLVLEVNFRLFASESCLQYIAKYAHGAVALGQQISFWWSVFSQIQSKQVQYSPQLLINEQLIDDNFLDWKIKDSYQQEFQLIYSQMFGEFPDASVKYYSRYQRGDFSYMLNRTGSIMPGRALKSPSANSNSQPPFACDLDEWEPDENDFDENNPYIRDVPIFSQQQYQTSIRHTNQNKHTGTYYTPQIKRKRIQDPMESTYQNPVHESLNLIQTMIKDLNKKIDYVTKKENDFEKKLDNVDKRLGGLIRKVNKNPVPSETPSDLPPIIYNGRNLLRDPLSPTPGCLMKKLINELFTKNEIMEDNHEQENERTTKIKDAIETAFFQGDKDKVEGFWEYEGKIIRGNQRRGLAHRKKLSLLSEQQIATFDEPTIKTVNNNENQ
ncbi:unnamed protein product, partial [Rotaria sp. Silwood2]